MLINSDGTVIHKGARKALEDVQGRLWKIRAAAGDEPENALTRATLNALAAEEDVYQRILDEDVITRWERTHAQYWTHRHGMEEYAENLRTLAPEYCAAVHRERRRYDVAHEAADTLLGREDHSE